MRPFRSLAHFVALFCLASACSDPAEPPDDDDDPPGPTPITSFSFLSGSWEVEGTFVREGGEVAAVSGQVVVRSDISGRALKEQQVVTRGTEPVEVLALIVPSENPGAWLVARGDGERGTFDVLEGDFVSSQITLLSREGTRPDGGMIRESYTNVTDEGFEWTASRSDDGGQTWSLYAALSYSPAPGSVSLDPPAQAVGCLDDHYRQFDFWEGQWSAGSATNDLEPLLGGCILEENWEGGETGTSFNMYDPRSGLWNQVWTDTNQFTLVIYGGIDGNRLVMSGSRLGALQRISWTPLEGDQVRQLGESSANQGTTWATSYDITYTPR